MFKLLFAVCCFGVCFAELKQVFAAMRHGARHQASSFLATQEEERWMGELSPIGYRQVQTLGNIIRKEYIEHLQFLPTNYDPDQIECYSTLKSRTVESAQAFLYGLYQ